MPCQVFSSRPSRLAFRGRATKNCLASRIAASASSNRANSAAALRCLDALARQRPEQKRGSGPEGRFGTISWEHILHQGIPVFLAFSGARARRRAKKMAVPYSARALLSLPASHRATHPRPWGGSPVASRGPFRPPFCTLPAPSLGLCLMRPFVARRCRP